MDLRSLRLRTAAGPRGGKEGVDCERLTSKGDKAASPAGEYGRADTEFSLRSSLSRSLVSPTSIPQLQRSRVSRA